MLIEMDKEEILSHLYENKILSKLHKELLNGLAGSLETEYLQAFTKEFKPLPQFPVFSAVVNSLVANLIHHYAKDIIEIVVDIISQQELNKRN